MCPAFISYFTGKNRIRNSLANFYFFYKVHQNALIFIGTFVQHGFQTQNNVNYDGKEYDRGHLVFHSLLNSYVGQNRARASNNEWNKFIQYKGANQKQTHWEKRIRTYSQSCLVTSGFNQQQILSDFYFVAGTKPFNLDNPKVDTVKDCLLYTSPSPRDS